MSKNKALQSLLFNARLICLVKFQAVEKRSEGNNTKVSNLHEKYYSLFAHFSNPKFWSQDIVLIAGTTSVLILDVDSVNPSETEDYLKKATKLFKHLKEDLLKAAIEGVGSTDTSTWNLKMLNALRKTLQQEDDRETHFNDEGHDLDNNEEFQGMKNHQQDLVATYTELLISNAVQATEKKVTNVKKRGKKIEKVTELPVFFTQYNKLSAYINKQITGVSLIPFAVEPPSENNQNALYELSCTLVKLDQKIAELAADGKDLSQEADFPSLSKTQFKAQKKFRNALLSNKLDLSGDDTEAIKDIANSLPNVSRLDTLKEKYQAVNKLMKDHLNSLS